MARRWWDGPHAWDSAEDCEEHDWLEPDTDPIMFSQSESEGMLFDMLVDLKLSGVLSATKCCVLAFWAGKVRKQIEN